MTQCKMFLGWLPRRLFIRQGAELLVHLYTPTAAPVVHEQRSRCYVICFEQLFQRWFYVLLLNNMVLFGVYVMTFEQVYVVCFCYMCLIYVCYVAKN
jgi:hypothetical protein